MLRSPAPWLGLVAALGLGAGAPAGASEEAADVAPAGDLLITNVHVVPMDRERVLPRHALLLRGDGIVWLGPASAAGRVRARRTIDGEGAYVAPGLLDMHVHVQDEDELSLYLLNGVTTVMNLAGRPEHLDMRGRIRARELTGPMLYTAGPILDGDPRQNPGFTAVGSAERAREVVADQHARGYDVVKIYDLIAPEAYLAAVEKAHALGRSVVGHIPKQVGLEAVLDRHAVVAHAEEYFYTFFRNEDDASRLGEAARLTAKGRLAVIPNTAFIHAIIAQAEDLAAVLRWPEVRYLSPAVLPSWLPEANRYVGRPPEWLARNKRMYPFLLKLTGALHEAGVPLFTGTDASAPGAVPGFSLHRELADLVQAGLTPFEALRAATATPGEWLTRLGRDTPAGRIAEGRRADLVLVKRNPLEDVAALRSLEGLVVRGRWIDLASCACGSTRARPRPAACWNGTRPSRARSSAERWPRPKPGSGARPPRLSRRVSSTRSVTPTCCVQATQRRPWRCSRSTRASTRGRGTPGTRSPRA